MISDTAARREVFPQSLVPEGAKNIDVAKNPLRYFIQPQVNNEWLKVGLGRNFPVMPATVKNDPSWLADPHLAAYTQQGVLGLTVPAYWACNPAYAQVQSEHVWSTAWFDVLNGGMSPEEAADKASKRITDIFARYPIAQS
jgi:multiple sugar transport system substrate-binding protein